MARTRAYGVSIWFWARDCPTTPDAVRNYQGYNTIDIATWSQPDAYFPSTTCDHSTHFDAHTMTFDLTFCVSVLLLLAKTTHRHVYIG